MATPRTTRSASKAPLPVIDQKQSQAYGAKGKANLRSQVGGSSPDFASAFAANRDESEVEDDADQSQDDHESAPPSRSQSPVKKPSSSQSPAKKRGRPAKKKPAADLSAVDEEDEEVEPEDELPEDRTAADRTGTALGSDITYFGGRRAEFGRPADLGRAAELGRPIRPANPLFPPESPIRRRAPSDVRRSAAEVLYPAPEVHRPAPDARVHEDAAPANQPSRIRVKDALFALLSMFFLVTVFAWMPLPTFMNPARDRFTFGLKTMFRISPYDRPPDVLEAQWLRFKHDEVFKEQFPQINIPDMQYAININLKQQVEELAAAFAKFTEEVNTKTARNSAEIKAQNDTLDALRKILPENVLVRIVNDRYEIPEPFWVALKDRMSDLELMKPLLDSYVANNEEMINEYIRKAVDIGVARAVLEMDLLDVETFQRTYDESTDRQINRLTHILNSQKEEQTNLLRTWIDLTVRQQLMNSPALAYNQEQLEMIAKGNLVLNKYEVLHTRNWFSTGLGARVDPQLTSATKGWDDVDWPQYIWRNLNILNLRPNGPFSALQEWDEATQCWCASHAGDGFAQITINMPHKIFPQRLVIEHIPAHGTGNIAAAPKIVEVWAHTASEREAQEIGSAMADLLDDPLDCGPAPAPKLVCVARGMYDIHYENFVQAIPMATSLSDMAMGINKVTVRVTENWGSPHTCLYRLRMTGAPVDAKV